MNYQGKYVALLVYYNKKKFYLPCLPSTSTNINIYNHNNKRNVVWIDDVEWNTYEDTYTFLKKMNEEYDIPSKPIRCVVEDGALIIGILTETNQLVPIKPISKSENIYKLPIIAGVNTIESDKIITNYSYETNTVTDDDRYLQYIKLENEFYLSFRTTIRMLMANIRNHETIKNMLMIITDENQSYKDKLRQIKQYLEDISKEHIEYGIYDDSVLMSLNDIFTCNNSHDNDKKNYCVVSNVDNKIKLFIPQYNLLTKQENTNIYYTRLADELIRNNRVHLFMFYPQQYMNISSNEYKIFDNEILIPKYLLHKYFDNIMRHKYGEYAKNIPYENALPK